MADNLKFSVFESIIDPSFWHSLCRKKLDEDMLEEIETPIVGFYLNSVLMSLHVDYNSIQRNDSTNKNISLSALCNTNSKYSSPIKSMDGFLLNFNTLKNFKELDKNKFIKEQGLKIRKIMENPSTIKCLSSLNQFFVITYADLKSFNFYYWFGFPALASLNFKIIQQPKYITDVFSPKQIEMLLLDHDAIADEQDKEFFCAELSDGKLINRTLNYFIDNTDDNANLYVCIIDPSPQNFCIGWTFRNILAFIHMHRKLQGPIDIIALKIGNNFKSSFTTRVVVEGKEEDKWVGWEKNARSNFGPRHVNLSSSIDPIRLAESSVDLNLKLMKWRLVKDIDLDVIQSQKCLLLGAGTLGCAVARCLMAWGVRNITFVDNGIVSFSNPVRQSLYTYEDCDYLHKGSKKKATAAAESLKKIFPSMITSGIVMDIPMPGHVTEKQENVDVLHDLINNHDVVFLLTDSRESRWLPTVIASVLKKLAITVALGFDTYLIMRHGIESKNRPKLGCYFCNDVTAPGNSLTDKTLDQQCTVTRPGVSYIASSMAVELYVSLLQHNQRGEAEAGSECLLGTIPHSIRGFLSQFSHITPKTNSFSQCIACSSKVLEEYNQNRQQFIKLVLENSSYLEKLTELDELQKLSEMAEILELSDDDSS